MEDGKQYVSAVLINDQYKMIYRKSSSTQKKLIKDLQLDNYIGIWRRNKDKKLLGKIATKILEQFKSQVHELYLDVLELENPKDGDNKNNHIKLLQLINSLPDIEIQSTNSEINIIPELKIESKSIILNGLPPIIELEEHEMFRDANDEPFHIEVRGERSKDKILFKAKDVAKFSENERLIKTMLDDRKAYKEKIDYIILQENSMALMAPYISSEELSNKKINHEFVYLTISGLMRAASVSRNANANLIKLFDWLVNLFYIHQFGSYEERNELAQDLLKTILNDKSSGLYCIDLGTFDKLYDTMNISREQYPPEQYDKYHIYKFGLSKDLGVRLTQHQNKSNGYGRWSDKITLKWMILCLIHNYQKQKDYYLKSLNQKI